MYFSDGTQKWDGRSEPLTEKIYPNLTSKACRLSLELKTGKERKRHSVQMPRLLIERGIHLNLRVSGKVKAKKGVIGICRAGLETLRALQTERQDLGVLLEYLFELSSKSKTFCKWCNDEDIPVPAA
jgi:hypothetical protein